VAYCPRSSLPAKALVWLASRLAYLTPPRPPGKGGTPPLSLEVRLDAVGAVLLDGLSYRRAGRMVGISKTEVGDSLDLLLGELAALGFCQPDGTFITSLNDLGQWLAEMAEVGEAVCVDGLATRVQRPAGWANQKVLYDPKRHSHTAQGLSVSTIWGDLLWVDGDWPGSCHEHELLTLAGWTRCWMTSRSPACWTAGSVGWPRHASTGMRRSAIAAPGTASATPSGPITACRRGCGRWWSSRSPIWPTPGRCAAVPGPGRLPRRRRAGLPWPLAAPGPHMTEA
jgi:hypothetical protein